MYSVTALATISSWRRTLRTHPVYYSVGIWGSLPDIKRPELEVNYSPSASVKVKNEWQYTCTVYLSVRPNGVDTNSCTFYSACTIGCTDSRSARIL